jgi:hypothetical protein
MEENKGPIEDDGTMVAGPGPVRLPTVCDICGALVGVGSEKKHRDWHEGQAYGLTAEVLNRSKELLAEMRGGPKPWEKSDAPAVPPV